MTSNSNQTIVPTLSVEGDSRVLYWRDNEGRPMCVPVTPCDDPCHLEFVEFWSVGFVGKRENFNLHFKSYRGWDEDTDETANEIIVVLTTQRHLCPTEEGYPDVRQVQVPVRLECIIRPASPPEEYFNQAAFDTDPYWAFPHGRPPTRGEIWWTKLRRFF